ncbi:MAG TPA: glycosyltransferase, partial [Verrucomicrobiae bacterium]|nr:glycosyltransferase [Verrucomicrobiae bacterium]
IVPLEAQACGTPVIALKKGGALESVKTGLFFEEQTAECLREAVRRFETMRFDRGEAVRRMADFDKQRFKEKIAGFVNGVMEKAGHGIAKA